MEQFLFRLLCSIYHKKYWVVDCTLNNKVVYRCKKCQTLHKPTLN